MAKKKKGGAKKKSSSRRRVGAAGNSVISTALGVVGGAILGPVAVGFVSKMVPASVNPKMVQWGGAILEAGGGYYLTKKSKTPLLTGMGYGLMAAGGLTVVKTVAPNLIGAVPVLIPTLPARGMVAGPRDVPRIGDVSGYPKPATVGRMSNMTRIYGGM